MARQYIAFCLLIALTGWLTSIIYHQTNKEWVAFGQGEGYFEQRQIPEALEAYKDASKLGLKAPKLYLKLAYCYSELSNYEAAIVWYELYLKERPTDMIARYRYAEALSILGKSKQAIEEYKKIDEDNESIHE